MDKEKSAYIYKKSAEKKTRNRVRLTGRIKKHAYSLTMLFFLMVIAICTYFISDYSHVQSLSVTGNKELTDQEILEKLAVNPRDSMYEVFLIQDKINLNLMYSMAQVESSQLHWKGLNNIEVQVSELATMAYLEQKGSYRQILEDGQILEEGVDIPQGNRPVLIDFEGEALEEMVEEVKKIDGPVRQSISEIVHTPSKINSKKITVYMKDGNQVIGLYSNISNRINYYPTMVESVDNQAGIFNLETGAYFTPFERKIDPKEAQENQGVSPNNETLEEAIEVQGEESATPSDSSGAESHINVEEADESLNSTSASESSS